MTNETENADGEKESSQPSETPRRGFMTEALAVLIGGIVGLFPLVVGLLVFLDPLRKRKKRNGNTQTNGPEGFLRVAQLDELLVEKTRRYTIYDTFVDAWNTFQQEPVGAVYLYRKSESEVIALNTECPHAGCAVDFSPDRKVYQCPCHDSSFRISGEIANERSPSARALDSLEVNPGRLQAGEVWVKFQSFQAGTAEKIVQE